MQCDFVDICLKIKNAFYYLLEALYENHDDIPNVKIKVYIKSTHEKAMLYTLDKHGLICVKESTSKQDSMNELVSLSFENENFNNYSKYYGTFHNCNMIFMVDDSIASRFVIRPLAKYFFVRINRYLVRFFEDGNKMLISLAIDIH